MIKLFHINNYDINTSRFSNLLHDDVVNEFEQNFANYVGAKYACSANSASSLLFLSLLKYNTTISIPSIMPIAVPNVIVNSGNSIEFYDDVDWVGSCYHLHRNIYDSAQQVSRNQYADLAKDDAIMIFSFYPTKPVGSCDGGMVVSNDKKIIDWFRVMTLNGTEFSENNWNRTQHTAGYKMHSTSIQAYIANENLKKLDAKNERLEEISTIYNNHFGLSNRSKHLYRINVENNKAFVAEMKKHNIICGIHYECCHNHKSYKRTRRSPKIWMGNSLPLSDRESTTTVSLPFHEMLTDKDIEEVLKTVEKLK